MLAKCLTLSQQSLGIVVILIVIPWKFNNIVNLNEEIVLKNKVFEKYIDQDEIFKIVKNIERINKSKILNRIF